MKYLGQQIKIKSAFLGLSVEALASKANMTVERLKEIINGKEITVSELVNISRALEINFLNLAVLSENTNSCSISVVNSKRIEKLYEARKVEELVLIFLNNKVVALDGEVYTVGAYGKITGKIEPELLKKIYYLMMKKGYYGLVSLWYKNAPVKIESLSELDEFGEVAKNYFLYGDVMNPKTGKYNTNNNIQVYFEDIFNSVNEEDKKEMLEVLERKERGYKNQIEGLIKEGYQLYKVDSSYIFRKNHDAVDINLISFKNESNNETFARINREIKKLYLLVKEETTFVEFYKD